MKLRFLALFFLILSCESERKILKNNLSYLPANASVISKINRPDAFASELKNNAFLQKVLPLSLFSKITEKTSFLGLENLKEDALIGIYPLGRNQHDFVLVQEMDSIPLLFEDSREKKIETLRYENQEITKYSLGENTFYSTKVDDKHLFSSSQLLLENSIRTQGKNPVSKSLDKLFKTTDPSKPASFFFNLKNDPLSLTSNRSENTLNLQAFADWISFDLSAGQDELLMNGVAVANDSIPKFVHLFDGTTPLSDKTAAITPQNANAILNFSFNDYDQFLRNQKKYLDLATLKDTGIQNIEEVGIIYLNESKAVALHAIDSEEITSTIEQLKTGSTTYQGSTIWQLQKSNVITEHFQPLVADFDNTYYVVLENTHIFAEKEGVLQTIIANQRSGFTFDKGPIYQTVKKQLGNESSMLFISSSKGINSFVSQFLDKGLAKELEEVSLKDYGFGAQLTNDIDFSHFNLFVTNIKKVPTKNTVAPIYNLELNSDLIIQPQFVKNHRNKKYEIVVQDSDYNLYLISTEGKVLWKKQLGGSIQGKIHQVDLYKNGKLQLAFCTNNEFLILDRNGDEVAPFTISFEGGNLNGLAVFDYENNRNYRFVVTQGRKIYMYNSKGDIVKGFTYTESESPIIAPPKHFKLNQKDYLVFQLENGKLKIRHRAGGERIKVNRTISFSNNEVFLYKNKFSITDNKGVLHQVDAKGKLSATNFNLSRDHGMFATSKTLVLMDDNILNIKGKKVELEFGVYSRPTIFYINDKIYVAVTDQQNQKIYLFDSQGKPIPNFPVYGTSTVDMLDMDNDGKLELVAKDQENSIIVYALN